MSVLYDYLITAGIDPTPASWGCVFAFTIIIFAIVTVLVRVFTPRKK